MSTGDELVRVVAPGRVNLIGEHTDYTGGLVLPMAVELATTVELRRHGDHVELVSAAERRAARVPLSLTEADVAGMEPPWARFAAGVVAVVGPPSGGHGTVVSTVPIGAGMSSSSALTVALTLALAGPGPHHERARQAQRAEQIGSGVPGGIMDQLCALAARAGSALLIDCSNLDVTPVELPEGVDVLVVHSGETRSLATSAYAERRHQCEEAELSIGPLRSATAGDVETLTDALLRRRARHVVSENDRVRAAVAALRRGDAAEVGRLMSASHASLRDDYEVSTAALDGLVERLGNTPGVLGARLMGAGFGGCVVALTEGGAVDPSGFPTPAWVVHPSAGATFEVIDRPTPR